MQTSQIKFCKIPGHQSKRITKICISPHNCTNRYLCDLCVKTTHQELPIDQFLIRLKNQHKDLVNINKMDELTNSIFRDLNKYRRFIEQQFDQFEQKLRSIQTNIQNAYHNTLFILEQLHNNPFNEETLNRNIQVIHDEKKRECENYLKKGQHLLKQQYNIMYERTTNFKLINQTSKLQLGWQLKGLEENLNMQDKKVLFFSHQTQELMYLLFLQKYMKRVSQIHYNKVIGLLQQKDSHILKEVVAIMMDRKQENGLKLQEMDHFNIIKQTMFMKMVNLLNLKIINIVIYQQKQLKYWLNMKNQIRNKQKNNYQAYINLLLLQVVQDLDLDQLVTSIVQVEKWKSTEQLFVMYILLIFQLAYSETYLLKEGQIKSLFFLPLNAYDIELHTDDDPWGICQLQKNRLDNEYYAYTSEQNILAMLTLSQHSILIVDANLQLLYFQDQIPLWSQSLPLMETNDISLKYCQVTYQVYLISNMVYQFNPYEKNISEFQIFLTYRPQQIEIEDQYIFVLHETKIQIYQHDQLFDTIELHNTSQISIFKVLINNNGGYSIYLVDKITGLCKIDWIDQQYTINQIDLIQNGVGLALLDESNIFVVYKRQYKYIIAQYQLADQQLQIIKKISSKKPLIKIVTTKDYILLITKNKIDLLYQNQIYTILKHGIQDISLYGTKILGISQYDIFSIQFETLPSQIQCFYHIQEEKNIQYSIVYNEINKTIHKKKFDFDIQLLTQEKNYTNIIVISSVVAIIFIIILIYSYMIFKQRTVLINNLEKNLKKTKVKQVPLFKSLECVISPKNQHSKLQSFDQTSNFDLARMKN